MRAVRREIIRSFIARLETTQIIQVSKVLRGIFDGIAVG